MFAPRLVHSSFQPVLFVLERRKNPQNPKNWCGGTFKWSLSQSRCVPHLKSEVWFITNLLGALTLINPTRAACELVMSET